MKQILINELSVEELKSMIDDSVVAAFLKLKNQEEPKTDKLLSRQEAAIFIDVSLPTLNEYTKSGKVKGYRLGGKIKYKQSELLEAMNAIEPLKYRRG